MKIERVDHPAPFGHPLNGMLKAWSEPWLREHYAERPDLDGLRARGPQGRQQNVAARSGRRDSRARERAARRTPRDRTRSAPTSRVPMRSS